ncbi:phage portal protein [Methylocystis sp. JR02]|uniref:phage portal protein n=1 Tax=Methylocystis sp. JR02 TaxID=3046284 RepID=UPI0024BB7FFE|nr:phage portal protein [Methylocystis sp. JR02]MDJ0449234.1 phage portal protein [Methylocystis sp. JR02]
MVWPFTRRKSEPGAKQESPPFIGRATPHVERKASAVGALISARVLKMPQWAKRDFDKSAREGYQQNPIVNACVYMTARAAAAVPLEIYQGEKEADIPDLAALLNRPNPMQDGEAFRIATISDLLLAGEFFSERVDVSGKPKELYRWSPGRTSVNPGDDGFPKGYTFKASGGGERTVQVDIPKGEMPVLHVREYNPLDDWRGMPNIDPAAFAIDMHTNGLRWNNALLNNGAQPSGALVYAPKEGSDKLSDDQWERLKAELDEAFAGAKNAGKPLLLDGGLDWREMGLSPKDMGFSEGLHEAARLIALAFGVPPLILGIPGDNTFANYQEANKVFYRQSVLPLLGQWCRAVSWWLGPSFGKDIRIVPDTDDLEVFADERAAEWDRIEKSTTMTINEKREKQGLKPAPGGDVILVSSTLIPLEAAGSMPEDGESDVGGAPEDEDSAEA